VPATTAHRSTTVPATATALRERITAHQHHRPESDSGQCNAELFHNDSFPSNPRSSVRRIAAETSSGLATRAVTRSAMIVRQRKASRPFSQHLTPKLTSIGSPLGKRSRPLVG
jgi:hypothetical protein